MLHQLRLEQEAADPTEDEKEAATERKWSPVWVTNPGSDVKRCVCVCVCVCECVCVWVACV